MRRKIIGWNNVPFDFKTKKSWEYKFKNILENEYSTAEVEFQVGVNSQNLATVPLYHNKLLKSSGKFFAMKWIRTGI